MYSLCSANYIFCTLGKAYKMLSLNLALSLSFCIVTTKVAWDILPCDSPRPGAPSSIPLQYTGEFPPSRRSAAAPRFARLGASRKAALARTCWFPLPPGPPDVLQISIGGYPFSPCGLLSASRCRALSACHRDLLTAVPQFSTAFFLLTARCLPAIVTSRGLTAVTDPSPQFSTALFLLTARCLPFLEFISHLQSQR